MESKPLLLGWSRRSFAGALLPRRDKKLDLYRTTSCTVRSTRKAVLWIWPIYSSIGARKTGSGGTLALS
jgi:hypothetical protein